MSKDYQWFVWPLWVKERLMTLFWRGFLLNIQQPFVRFVNFIFIFWIWLRNQLPSGKTILEMLWENSYRLCLILMWRIRLSPKTILDEVFQYILYDAIFFHRKRLLHPLLLKMKYQQGKPPFEWVQAIHCSIFWMFWHEVILPCRAAQINCCLTWTNLHKNQRQQHGYYHKKWIQCFGRVDAMVWVVWWWLLL